MIHDQRPLPAKKEAGMAILEIVLDLYVSVTPGVHTGDNTVMRSQWNVLFSARISCREMLMLIQLSGSNTSEFELPWFGAVHEWVYQVSGTPTPPADFVNWDWRLLCKDAVQISFWNLKYMKNKSGREGCHTQPKFHPHAIHISSTFHPHFNHMSSTS